MKYCPFCGATLLGGAASFCAECGKAVPLSPHTQSQVSSKNIEPVLQEDSEEMSPPALASGEPLFPDTTEHPQNHEEPSPKNGKKKPSNRKRSKKGHARKERPSTSNTDAPDDGYDGYYDDVRPSGSGYENEGMDPELIKKIIMVTAGATLIIALAITLMLLL